MIAFCLRRFMWLVLTLWIVFTVTFLLMHAVPGGPFDSERALPAFDSAFAWVRGQD